MPTVAAAATVEIASAAAATIPPSDNMIYDEGSACINDNAVAAGTATATIAISRSSTRATRAPGRYRDRTAGGNVNRSVRTSAATARPAADATADAVAARRTRRSAAQAAETAV